MSKIKEGIKNKLSKLKLNKKTQIAVAGVLAVVMVIIFLNGITTSSSSSVDSKTEQVQKQTITSSGDYVLDLERRLENIVSSIKGVKKANAFIMVETSVECIYATNEEEKISGENSISNSSEIIFSKEGSATTPVKKLEIYPKIIGVLIVLEGTDDEKVRLLVINAVSVALNLENSKIEVLAGKDA